MGPGIHTHTFKKNNSNNNNASGATYCMILGASNWNCSLILRERTCHSLGLNTKIWTWPIPLSQDPGCTYTVKYFKTPILNDHPIFQDPIKKKLDDHLKGFRKIGVPQIIIQKLNHLLIHFSIETRGFLRIHLRRMQLMTHWRFCVWL